MNRRTPQFGDDFDDEEIENGFEEPVPARPRARLLPTLLVTVTAAGFGGALWYAYSRGPATDADAVVPLVAADSTPTKYRPDQPGGLEVPHQDKLVFSRLNPDSNPVSSVEQLLPPPEEPMPKPEPEPEPEPVAELEATSDTAENAEAPAEPAPAVDAPAAPEQTPAPTAVASAEPPPAAPAVEEPRLPAAAPPGAESAQAEAAAPAPVASGGYRVQLASVQNEAAALSEIKRLRTKYGSVLGSLDMQSVRADLGAKGIYYRIQAGPLDEAGAASLCGTLKAQGVGCLVVKP